MNVNLGGIVHPIRLIPKCDAATLARLLPEAYKQLQKLARQEGTRQAGVPTVVGRHYQPKITGVPDGGKHYAKTLQTLLQLDGGTALLQAINGYFYITITGGMCWLYRLDVVLINEAWQSAMFAAPLPSYDGTGSANTVPYGDNPATILWYDVHALAGTAFTKNGAFKNGDRVFSWWLGYSFPVAGQIDYTFNVAQTSDSQTATPNSPSKSFDLFGAWPSTTFLWQSLGVFNHAGTLSFLLAQFWDVGTAVYNQYNALASVDPSNTESQTEWVEASLLAHDATPFPAGSVYKVQMVNYAQGQAGWFHGAAFKSLMVTFGDPNNTVNYLRYILSVNRRQIGNASVEYLRFPDVLMYISPTYALADHMSLANFSDQANFSYISGMTEYNNRLFVSVGIWEYDGANPVDSTSISHMSAYNGYYRYAMAVFGVATGAWLGTWHDTGIGEFAMTDHGLFALATTHAAFSVNTDGSSVDITWQWSVFPVAFNPFDASQLRPITLADPPAGLGYSGSYTKYAQPFTGHCVTMANEWAKSNPNHFIQRYP